MSKPFAAIALASELVTLFSLVSPVLDVLTADSDGKTSDTTDRIDDTTIPASAIKPKITTFDARGTRFIGPEITFDRKMNPEWQLMFSKSSITDGITHVSKQRELVRTV